VENEIFSKHQSTATRDEDVAHTVVHFTPQKIMDHPKYLNLWCLLHFAFFCNILYIQVQTMDRKIHSKYSPFSSQ
jgi:hypothetical protein